jgi:Uma2 family endonuclease
MLATKIRYTFADLLEQDPADETIYDILGGDLVVFTSPNAAHAAAVAGLFRYLLGAEDAGFGLARTAPFSVAFDYAEHGRLAQDVTHPDLLFITRERFSIVGHQCVEAAPDLIVEVLSPTTRTFDLPGGPKFAIYERYGVRHYWIVDVDARTIAQYTWENGRYVATTVLRPEDTLTCPLFPGLTRPVAQIFAGIA